MKKTKAQIGKSARTKGHAFERWIAKELRAYHPTAKRGLQYQVGEHCPDIIGCNLFIEAKRYAKNASQTQLMKWFEIAKREMGLWAGMDNPIIPVVLVFKADKKPIRVFVEIENIKIEMTWDEFIEGYINSKGEI